MRNNIEIEIDAKDFRNKLDIKDGRDGKDGANGIDGKDGYTPIKNKDYFDGEKGDNGSPDTGEEIIEKITPLRNSLDFRVLTNIPDFVLHKDLDQGGGGGSIIRFNDSTGAQISQYVTALQFGTGITPVYSAGGIITITVSGGSSQTLAQTLSLGNTTGGKDIVVSNTDKIVGAVGLLLQSSSPNNYYYAGPSYLFQQWYNGVNSTDFLLQGGGTQLYSDTAIDIQTATGLYGFFSGASKSGILNFTAITGTDKTFAFPNTSGTIALLSDISQTPWTSNINAATFNLQNLGDIEFATAGNIKSSTSIVTGDTGGASNYQTISIDNTALVTKISGLIPSAGSLDDAFVIDWNGAIISIGDTLSVIGGSFIQYDFGGGLITLQNTTINAGGSEITGVGSPTLSTNAATKGYVDGKFALGLNTTITTAALTALGSQGSMTFTNGLLTASTPAT